MNWLKEVDVTIIKKIDPNAELIIRECGVDVLLKLINLFGKSSIYFSERLIFELKKEYILKHKSRLSVKELCRELSVSEKYVYNVLAKCKK